MDFKNNLIIKKIFLDLDEVKDLNVYPFNIESIKNFKEINFDKPVTFLVGDNGIGKSTFIEALAVALGLPSEGGTQNFRYETRNTTSELANYIRIDKYRNPSTKFFLRAESFYNFATEVDDLGIEVSRRYGGSLHTCSHGESFLKLLQYRFSDNGLYILDEPEAALSPQNQLSLLCLINDLVKNGSQFIIATHSPILISYREGKILDLNQNFKEVKYENTDIYSLYKMYIENPYEMQNRLFD